MSQHYFHTVHQGEPITVVLGWDRALGRFFMIVERQHPKPDQDDYLYSNLAESEPDRPHLSYFTRKLDELGIQLPAGMVEQVYLDPVRHTANLVVTHRADGCFHGRATPG